VGFILTPHCGWYGGFMRWWFSLLLLMGYVAPVFAQDRRPFTFEDMMKLKRVGEPEVSPDGKWVVFSVVDVSLEANTKIPHIWIVPTAGGAEREIIADQDADRPRWSPDGKRFAFISTKEEGSQVWVADFNTSSGTVTATHKKTWIATGASGELWSPDGSHILFTSDVYPECDGAPEVEAACNAKKVKEAEHSKVKAQIFDHLLYRHWNAYNDGKRSHIFVIPADFYEGKEYKSSERVYAGAVYQDLTPGDFDAPVFSLGGQDDYAFSPDGQEICYTSNHDKNPAASTNNDLWVVSVNGGVAKNITADNPASDSTPLYSPDGKYIAYRAQKRPGDESDKFRLMVYNRKTEEKRDVLGNSLWDWVGTFIWTPDSSKIYYIYSDDTAREKGQNLVDSTTVEPRAMTPKEFKKLPPGFHPAQVSHVIFGERVTRGYDDDMTFSPDGNTLFFTRMSIQRPAEIQRLVPRPEVEGNYDLPMGEQLTHLNNTILSQISMSPLEPFFFAGAHGDKVQGFLVKPPTFDASKKYPVKFLIHGGPEGAWGDDWSYRWNPELFAANGYVVIMINFHGSTGYGQKFIDAINGDWGGAPFEDLMKGLDYAEQTYPFIDKDRECALGASYGGYAINWILGHTDRFKCLVSHDGMFNAESAWGSTEEIWFNNWEFKGTPYDNREMYQKWSPHQYARNFKTPTLVVHGQLDYRLDVSEGFQLFTTLQMLGVPSKMLYFPDEGHWVLKPQNSQLWYKTVNDWVDQWVK
jgi:dipeptidyl aminopeptidase/acylaminoacyl peptidase